MFCKNCGKTLNQSEIFCENCGVKVENHNNTSLQQQGNFKNNKLIKILAIIGVVVVVLIILFVVIFSIISSSSEKLVCKSNEGNITIMYNNSGITGYTARNMSYDIDTQKEYAKEIGMENYITEFNDWFISNTSGYCTINGEKISKENDNKEDAKVIWNDLKITIDGKQYSYPYKLSEFLENGWQVDSNSQEVINQTVAKASEYELSEVEKQWYIDNDYEIPENPTTLAGYEIYKENSKISFFVDPTQSDVLVKNADVIKMSIENTNFNFYGVEKGTTLKQVQDLFGTKNYELIEMDEDAHTNIGDYIAYYDSNKSVQFLLEGKTKLVNNITISIQ